ncbi:MAG: flagellar filament capping protein FliD [Spirochaetia bacterium]|nr:flagellar filament capping protein FliD [Spirochaetota bacterium]MDW8112038.1 flagellar filament capping protein FliD [Spirochaetia bacterium]
MSVDKKLLLFIIGTVFLFFVYNGYSQSSKKKFGIDKLTGSGINTEEIVEKLVEAESSKGEKYQQEISNQTIRKAIINFVELNLRELRDIAKSLYDYRSPFQNRVGYSSDDSIVQVLPNRGAEVGDMRVRVERMAKPDVFVSDPLPLDTELKPFKIKISLLDKEVEIDFGGGKLRDLAKLINEKASQIVSASVIKIDANNEVLRIEGKKTGKSAKVIINGDLSELVRIGLLTRDKVITSPPNELNILSQFTSLPSLTLKDKEEITRDIRYVVSKNTILEVSNLFTQQPIPKPKELEIRVMESVKVSNVEVKGGTPITTFDILKEYTTNDFVFIVIHLVDGTKYELRILPSETSKITTLSMFEGKEVEKFVLRNNNDLSRMTFYRIVIKDKVEEVRRLSEYEPKNYISRAENAVVYVNGVKIEREENDLKDIINGTLKVVGENPSKEVTTKVDYDYKSITNSISNLIEKYNDVMIYLSKITKPMVDRRQLYEKPDEEKEEGSFATDMEFIRLKDKLRMFAMQPYQTRQTNIRLLYHIGIYTKNISTKLDFESDLWEYVRRGILTIDNDKLVSVVIENIMAVSDVFSYDTNGDKVVDTGFAYNITVVCDEYTRAGGVIANKKKQIDNIIKSNKDLYTKFQDRLEDYRVSLERKFGKLQQVLRESKSKQDWFNSQVKVLSGENNR